MLDKVKLWIYTQIDRVYRRVIAHEIVKAMQLDTERNKVITCDFILEADTSPQDEFELFQYIYAQKNEHFVPYYVINAHCAAYPEIKAKYGDIPYSAEDHVKFSFFIKDLFKTTKFICGGFQVMHALNIGVTDAVKRSPYVYSFFTQHGVNFFKDNFISQSSYSAFLFDKIMISNEFEKNLFMERGCYLEENLVKNGLFRWDLLSADHAESKKSIFIYFTHRRYLRHFEEEDISETVYVQTIVSLLRNAKFNRMLEENGYTLKVALHHTVLQVCGNDILDGVQILKDEEIADAKKEAALLITDYSSMCFEMWFQHKPVIFLHIPDTEDCLTYGHKTDLPAPYAGKEDYIFNVVDTVEECVDKLEGYFKNHFRFSPEEKEKRDKFFYYSSNFCERFYNYLVATKNDTKTLYHMPLNTSVSFARYPNLNTYAIEMPSTIGRWIVRKKAHFSFIVPSCEKDLAIQIQYQPYLNYKQYKFYVKIFVNGHKVHTQEIYHRYKDAFVLHVPKNYIAADGTVQIAFRLSHVYRRKSLKTHSKDKRYLSLRLLYLDVLERDHSIADPTEQFEAINAERAARLEAERAAQLEAEEPQT